MTRTPTPWPRCTKQVVAERFALCEPELNERQLHARRRVHQAMAALGGISGPAGSCVWHVVGLQRSVREWAMRQAWGGRPVDHKAAAGILIAALGMLAAHLGYGGVKRAS